MVATFPFYAGANKLAEGALFSCGTAYSGQLPVTIHMRTTYTDHVRNVVQTQPGFQSYLATFGIDSSDAPSCALGAVPYILHLQPRICQSFNTSSQDMADCSQEQDWTVTGNLQLHYLQQPDGRVDASSGRLRLAPGSSYGVVGDMVKAHCAAPKSCLAQARRMLQTVAQQLSVR